MTYRVLFVDDEQKFLEACCELMYDDEIEIIPIDNAKEAFEIFKSENIDAIISDFKMDNINGFEFLDMVRKEDQEIPFIIFSRIPRKEALTTIPLGFTIYIQKDAKELQYQLKEICHYIRCNVEKRREIAKLSKKCNDLKFLVRTCAHDMHNKLSTVSIYNSMVLNQYTNKVHASILDMSQYLDNISNLVKNGYDNLERDIINLSSMVKKICNEIMPFSPIKFNLFPLPKIKGHQIHVEQIFHNLIINIVNHSQAKIVWIWSKLNKDDNTFQIFVRDNGKGIPPTYQQKIRSNWKTATPYDVSFGLGLMIVKNAVEEHNGDIQFSSGHKNGTTFRLTFPLDRLVE